MTPDALVTRADLDRLRDDIAAMLDERTIVKDAEWLTVEDAAARANVSVQTVRRWIRTGEVEARGAGKLRRVRLP
jgi:excisionase family DNA binding protein